MKEEEKEQEKKDIPKTQKEVFYANIQGKHPELEDEEAIFAYANDKYDRMRNERNAGRAVVDILDNSPEAMDFLQRAGRYGSVSTALKSIPKETLQEALDTYDAEIDDEVAREEISAMRKERDDAAAREEQLAANAEANNAVLEEFAKEMNMNTEDVVSEVMPVLEDISAGKISKDLLMALAYYKTRDNDLQSSYDKGVVDGRNENIESQMLTKKGDGLPSGTGGGMETTEAKMPELFRGVIDKRDGWDDLLRKSRKA